MDAQIYYRLGFIKNLATSIGAQADALLSLDETQPLHEIEMVCQDLMRVVANLHAITKGNFPITPQNQSVPSPGMSREQTFGDRADAAYRTVVPSEPEDQNAGVQVEILSGEESHSDSQRADIIMGSPTINTGLGPKTLFVWEIIRRISSAGNLNVLTPFADEIKSANSFLVHFEEGDRIISFTKLPDSTIVSIKERALLGKTLYSEEIIRDVEWDPANFLDACFKHITLYIP